MSFQCSMEVKDSACGIANLEWSFLFLKRGPECALNIGASHSSTSTGKAYARVLEKRRWPIQEEQCKFRGFGGLGEDLLKTMSPAGVWSTLVIAMSHPILCPYSKLEVTVTCF